MKRLRRRLTLIFLFLVALSSTVSLILSYLIRNDILFSHADIRYIVFGFAFKDLLLLISAVAFGCFLIFVFSKRTASPISALSEAATEIASGNLDVRIEESDRKDEIGELERQFRLMVRELQSNEYLKKDFISNVSHEFKTPLAIISGYAALLAEDSVSERDRKEYAGLIAKESERLTKLTSNILQLSKLNREDVAIQKSTFSLDEQIRRCILLLEPRWSEKNLRFELDLAPTTCRADENLLAEVWLNLIDNAIRFSHPDSAIAVTLKPAEDASCQVSVRDQGVGMEEPVKSHIFEQFYQGDTSHRQEGNGLGLAITAKIVELHRGSIRVESEPGEGSVFTVTLP